MFAALLAVTLTIQKGSPTTPLGRPPHPAKPPQVAIAREVVDKGGRGEAVRVGDLVTVHFTVRVGEKDIADTKKRGLPYTFKVGEKGNDPLLDVVVRGMKLGMTRSTSAQAGDVYGPKGAPPIISPRDILSITVTLISRGKT